jgi:hypothetical protein
VADHGLPRRILVLAWSMAGRIAQPLNSACRERDLEIELFVAMTATPPLPNLLPALDALRPDPLGLADASIGFFPWLVRCLEAQNERAGRNIIDGDGFLSDYGGNFPVNLAATALRYRTGRFVADPAEDNRDIGVRNIAGFPTGATGPSFSDSLCSRSSPPGRPIAPPYHPRLGSNTAS